jgi:hypothetical protein
MMFVGTGITYEARTIVLVGESTTGPDTMNDNFNTTDAVTTGVFTQALAVLEYNLSPPCPPMDDVHLSMRQRFGRPVDVGVPQRKIHIIKINKRLSLLGKRQIKF